MIHWNELCADVEHRPWPLPERPWAGTMTWAELAFVHWEMDADLLRALLPEALELDLFDGSAYVGIVPFRMENVGPRGLGWLPPRFPGPRSFPELNVRTYVRCDGRSGVWFFSLDATSRAAIEAARVGFELPYVKADIEIETSGGWTAYRCLRRDRRLGAGEFEARYRGVGSSYGASPESLERWLTERYCFFSRSSEGAISCGEVHHRLWPLRAAELEIEVNTIAEAHGLGLEAAPDLVHVVDRLDVVCWWPRRVTMGGF